MNVWIPLSVALPNEKVDVHIKSKYGEHIGYFWDDLPEGQEPRFNTTEYYILVSDVIGWRPQEKDLVK